MSFHPLPPPEAGLYIHHLDTGFFMAAAGPACSFFSWQPSPCFLGGTGLSAKAPKQAELAQDSYSSFQLGFAGTGACFGVFAGGCFTASSAHGGQHCVL